MSRLAVHKLSSLSLPANRALPASPLSFQSRSAFALSPFTSRCLSTSSSPLRSGFALRRPSTLSGRLLVSVTHPPSSLKSPSAICSVTVAVPSQQQRRHQSSSSSSSSSSFSSSTSSSIPRSLVFIAPAALLAYLVSELNLTPTAECATLPTLSSSSQTPISINPSPRLVAPLAGDDYVVASWWRRIVAFLIDNSLVSLAFSLADKYLTPLTGAYATIAIPLLSFAFNFTYETLCYVLGDGQTLGKWLLGIRLVRDDGQPIDVSTSGLVFGGKVLNILLMADVLYGVLNLDRDGKCIHNVISGTTVVRKVPAETFVQTVQV